MLEPDELLSALLISSTNPDSTDKIGINKDGINTKATYYNHIRTLFSLYLLDEDKQSILRCMIFVPQTGVRARMFAKWLGLNAMDDINELAELGFIANPEMDKILLLPMVKDIAATDLSPSVTKCITLLNSIQQVCLLHGEDVPYRKTLFEIVESIIRYAEKDNFSFYIRFIEDAFSYMEKYKYENGMRLIVSEMDMYKVELAQNDLALFYDCQSSVEAILNGNYNKAIFFKESDRSLCSRKKSAPCRKSSYEPRLLLSSERQYRPCEAVNGNGDCIYVGA